MVQETKPIEDVPPAPKLDQEVYNIRFMASAHFRDVESLMDNLQRRYQIAQTEAQQATARALAAEAEVKRLNALLAPSEALVPKKS